MDMTVLEVGTVGLLPLQGRVVVSRVDMGTLEVVLMAFFGLGRHSQAEVGCGFLSVLQVPAEWMGEWFVLHEIPLL